MISLLDWKVKVPCTLIVLTGMYFFHISEVKIAVNKAEMQLVQKYNEEISILEDKSKHSTEVLQQQSNQTTRRERLNFKILLVSTMILNAGCTTYPVKPAQAVFPEIPKIQKLEQEKLSQNFVEQMQLLLQDIVSGQKK